MVEDYIPEVKLVALVFAAQDHDQEWYDHLSSNERMLQIITHMRCFIAKCRHQTVEHDFLSVSELNPALFLIV